MRNQLYPKKNKKGNPREGTEKKDAPAILFMNPTDTNVGAALVAAAASSTDPFFLDPYLYVYTGKEGRHELKVTKEEVHHLTLKRPCVGCHRIFEHVKACNGCKSVWYCSEECQRKHWPQHRKDCVVCRIPEFRITRILSKFVRKYISFFDEFRRTLGVSTTFWVTHKGNYVTEADVSDVFHQKMKGLTEQYNQICPDTLPLSKQLRSLRRTPAGVEGPVYREKMEERYRRVEGRLFDPDVEDTVSMFEIRFEPIHEYAIQTDNATRILICSDYHPYSLSFTYVVIPHDCSEKGCTRPAFERHLRIDLFDFTGTRNHLRSRT